MKRIILCVSVIFLLTILIFSFVWKSDAQTLPLNVKLWLSNNPVMMGECTSLDVEIFSDLTEEKPTNEYIDVFVTIKSSLIVLHEGVPANNVTVRLFWKKIKSDGFGSAFFPKYYYLLNRTVSFVVNATAPPGNYPVYVTVSYGEWNFDAHEIVIVRKPVELTIKVVQNPRPYRDPVNITVVSVISGVYIPFRVESGIYKVKIPEGKFNLNVKCKSLFDDSSTISSRISVTDNELLEVAIPLLAISVSHLEGFLVLLLIGAFFIGLFAFCFSEEDQRISKALGSSALFLISFPLYFFAAFWSLAFILPFADFLPIVLIICSILYGVLIYYFGNYIPFKYFFISHVVSALVNYTFIKSEFIIKPELLTILWVVIMLAPQFVVLIEEKVRTRKRGLPRKRRLPISDQDIVKIAIKYGGVLTKSIVVYELNISLKEATKILDKFCKYGEARKINHGRITIYDFQSTRDHLARTDKKIIELLLDKLEGLVRSELLRLTELSMESLDESLSRLESLGIIYHELETGKYKLKGVMSS